MAEESEGWDYGTIALFIIYYYICLTVDPYFVFRLLLMRFKSKQSQRNLENLTMSSEMKGVSIGSGSDSNSLSPQLPLIMRDCELALHKFWRETGWTEAFAREKATVSLVGCSMPVFKSMSYVQMYKIRTQILCWKGDSLYLEQVVSPTGDPDKVFAICLARYRVDGALPHEVVHTLFAGTEISEECRADLGVAHTASVAFDDPPRCTVFPPGDASYVRR